MRLIFILVLFQIIVMLPDAYSQRKKELRLADQFKLNADQFSINRKRDSSVLYYEKAITIYKNYLEKKDDQIIQKNYIHCLNNYSYDLIILGKIEKALIFWKKKY